MGGKVVVVPTEEEIAPFRRKWAAACRDDLRIEVCGVGMVAVVEAVLAILHGNDGKPDLIILAGIAGAYSDSGLEIGDCVLVAEERVADAGAFRGERFEPFAHPVYRSPWVRSFPGFPVAGGNTVGVCAAPFLRTEEGKSLSGAAIENMEGAAFFAAMANSGVPFLELRAISNRVGEPREAWDVAWAAERLAEGLGALTIEKYHPGNNNA